MAAAEHLQAEKGGPHPPLPVPPKRAPTLYAIIAFKLCKGALFLTIAAIAYALSDNNLPKEFQNWLHVIRANPEGRFWRDLAEQVGKLTETRMLWAAVGTLVYSLFSLVEGLGLIFRVSWAGWLAIGESAFFIPLEVSELMHHFSIFVLVILILNVVMVWYLFQNRERLFRHHH